MKEFLSSLSDFETLQLFFILFIMVLVSKISVVQDNINDKID